MPALVASKSTVLQINANISQGNNTWTKEGKSIENNSRSMVYFIQSAWGQKFLVSIPQSIFWLSNLFYNHKIIFDIILKFMSNTIQINVEVGANDSLGNVQKNIHEENV